MLSLKQIGTICFLSIISISPTFADNETPSYITNASNCNQGVLHTTSAPASLEANYSANTINTTWYSNGTQLTGDNIPGTCRYDAALIPPTPAARPGYVFGGWTLKPRCEIPSSLVSTDGSSLGYKVHQGAYSENTSDYGLTEDNTWGVTWSNGDKVVGEAKCSAKSGDNHSSAWGGNSADWTSDAATLDNTAGKKKNCWCKATGYIASGESQCSLSSPSWVFFINELSVADCADYCAYNCAFRVRYYSSFKAAVFTGLVAE